MWTTLILGDFYQEIQDFPRLVTMLITPKIIVDYFVDEL